MSGTLTLWYYIKGADLSILRRLQSRTADDFLTVSDAIYDRHKVEFEGAGVGPSNLTLYAPENLPIDPEDDLAIRVGNNPTTPLRDRDKVQSRFADGRMLVDNLVHIVVVARQAAVTVPSKRSRPAGGVESVHTRGVKQARDASTPLSAAKPENIRFQQIRFPIYNGRPAGQPVAIYHSVLGDLKDAIDNPGDTSPSPTVLKNTHDLFCTATKYFVSEKDRMLAMSTPLRVLLGYDIHLDYNVEGARLDGVVMAGIDTRTAFLACMECKFEVGSDGDPGYQAACGWRKTVACSGFFGSTCSPCLIISILGPYICFMGAVFAGEYMVEPFTDYIFLGGDVYNEERVISVARIFQAINGALRQLQEYYTKVDVQTSYTLKPQPGIIGGNGPDPVYIDRFFKDTEHVSKAIFCAKMGDRDVIVKFISGHCRRAHEELARAGLAPALHFCGRIRGGLTMVVMDHIKGTTVQRLHDEERSLPVHTFGDFKAALETLHRVGYVHGDFRKPNLLVRGEDDKGCVIDFGWSGQDNEDRYPPTLNDTGDIPWAPGVERCGILSRCHDEHLLEVLRRDFRIPTGN